MTMMIPVTQAKAELDSLLAELPLGETLTLVGTQGEPVALVVSLTAKKPSTAMSAEEWIAEWEKFAKDVDEAWIGETSALDELLEMRR